MSSSTTYLNCRIEWRPSRTHALMLAALGVMSAGAVAMSALPWLLAVPTMLLVLAWGLWLARREMRRPAVQLSIQARDEGIALGLDGVPVRLVSLNLRGPLAVLVLADASRRHRFSFWPDTLSPETRRTFRLLKHAGPASPSVLPLVAG